MHASDTISSASAVKFSMPKMEAGPWMSRSDSENNDFIPHPTQFPLHYRRRPLLPWANRKSEPTAGDVGLSFICLKYIAAGTRLTVEIPLRGRSQRFSATVVLVKERPEGFEIGLWFSSTHDALRARIVERICHTECYLKARHKADA